MASPAEPIKSLSDSGSNSSSDGSDSDSSSSSGSSSSSESEAEDNASEAAPSAARAVPDAKPVMSTAPGGSPPPDADPADLLADARTNPKIVRTIHKALQRYGDLTDAPGCNEDPSTFCDELRQPNYIVRAKLCNSLKLPDDIIQTVSNEIVSLCHANLSEENVKFGDVDIKPAALIERLQENLKLRVAVQRALKKSGNPSQGAYGLATSRRDLVDLGIEQMPAWGYVEKECDWSPAKDRALLLGVYIHGVGYWEDILGDAKLAFEKHRVLTGTRLKGRAEDLLRKLPSPSGKPLATSSTSDSIRREHVAQQPTPSFGGKQLRVLPPAPVESEEEGEISADDETTSGANTIMPRYGGKNIRIMPPQKPTKVLLTSEQLVDKWDPKALLKDVKVTLKKVQKISSWGEDHSDDVLVEKVSKYLVEIGHVIDSLVCREDDMAMDELATCLWEYAATFTPFSALHFERLYDDMVADASHSRR
ncbi:hypothetical protein SPRG_20608 [Saprolegnia parasitica CBS 223.65]|uniref:Chromodomain-helicase-DNA-binding protein 1-like C-terminal domain-containing protein n=1 Tax=Saprolegnia parasitica (strain CBS 223.65) TaxID=695850 RepID=A0A067CHU3_SAPPC|nr:hypothetical protein SPRG_20608 [Saprolegnia parasitica CBS 223.65]KDO26116.1 hypothetical protein SPRG_20608 [Saprolegnia parasitica CBS 223.65]|eukprot:XP_012203216.1 hypothetical protein SPRG_20608 [Saprolegnia parasitica CBS 223.65]